ncbi:carboxylesterase family protein [uncultured Microscilla sp.]|uniref:carboxylesterase family protein n=1 Tax=uncultured Microscilla sp. TaxID=432653 RepID=UPI002615462E|nr:carboxylesterase family protein [uncultured Microscilla sp.]
MKRLTTLLSLMLLAVAGAWAQQRYIDEIFTNVNETKGVRFSTQVPEPKPGGGWYESVTGLPINAKEHDTRKRDLFMDIFKPIGDNNTNRPVLIVCFGGGFVAGDRNLGDIRTMAIRMAKRGYVTAAIDYRLGMNVFDEGAALRAVYRGVQDGRSAIRYFRANAASLGVDPNQIFIAGHSAGAFIAVQTAYLDKDNERPADTRNSSYRWGSWLGSRTYDLVDQGCLDCAGDNKQVSGAANAIVSLAGAVGFLEHIEGSSDIPNVMFHSKNDNTVPYDSGQPFGSISWLVAGFDLPIAYGSSRIDSRANQVNAPRAFYSYDSRGHDVHVNGNNRSNLHSDILPRMSQYLYDTRLSPAGLSIAGASIVNMQQNNTQTYTIDAEHLAKVKWQMTGGKIIRQKGNKVTVCWNTPGEHRLSAIPYAANDAKGSMVSVPILVMGESGSLQADLQMFPNPSAHTLKIKLNEEGVHQVKIAVYNERGQVVYQNDVNKQGAQFNINVLNLPLGKYYIKIQDGGRVVHKTFLKY